MDDNKKSMSLQMESEIIKQVYADNKRTAHFSYNQIGEASSLPLNKKTQLVVTTFNPDNGESFVMKTFVGRDKEDCLGQVLDYLDLIKKNENSFTVSWARKGEHMDTHKSHFYANSVVEVVEKFFANKMVDEYIVYEIKLNPIA